MRGDHNLARQTIAFRVASLLLAIVLTVGGLATIAIAEEPFQVEVNILSAPVKAGATPIGTVKRGDKLTAHEFNGGYYLVDLPGANPPQQGWIGRDDCHRVPDDLAELKRRIAALPAEQRKQAVDDFKAEFDRLSALERRYKMMDTRQQLKESVSVGRELADAVAELVGPKSMAAADEYEMLANRVAQLGDYPAARKYYEQALAIQRDSWRRQIADLEAKERQSARQLTSSGANIKAGDPWIAIDDLRAMLPVDDLLVDIARFYVSNFQAKGKEPEIGPAHYAAWLIPPAGKGEIQIVDLGDAEAIDRLVAAVRQGLDEAPRKIQDAGAAEAERAIQKPLRDLAVAVLDPIVAKAGDAKRLLLSPDGALWLAPFAALPMADGKYAIEKYQIDYLVSGRELLGQPGGGNAKITVNKPVIVANPDFDLAPAEALAETRAVLAEHSGLPTDPLAMRATGESLATVGKVRRLTGTAEVADEVRPHLVPLRGAAEPAVFTDKRALEGVVKAVKSPRVLMLSTHGFFLPDQVVKHDERLEMIGEHRGPVLTVEGKPLENPLLRCGLLLAVACNRRDEATTDDDGVLTGIEIVGTDLRGTELVVLSACDTGLGDIHNGEGVAGLRQAFQLAGARFVLSTLWSISDQKTVPIMTGFFQNLAAGDAHGAALRKSQLALIQSLRKEFAAAAQTVLYWAAFTLTGQ